ncbi:MAG: AAA family ATPase [Succinimonas sp.]|nr:AAA family ATPase [Succinimonas sp.]
MKKIPSSISSFKDIKEQNLAYIDKTEFIKNYEDLNVFNGMFLRPPGFGKTMFTEILRYYYDIVLQNEADKLFKGTWIADHPTPYKNSYAVLKFDFSSVRTISSIDDTMDFFMDQVIKGIADFYINYPDLIISEAASDNHAKPVPNDVKKYYGNKNEFTSPAKIISHFLLDFLSRRPSFNLMIIIDEYDNFTNDLLSSDPKMFPDLTRKKGELGAFFSVLRNYQQSGTIERIFITGVLPIYMDTAVSGFTSVKLTFTNELKSLTGFTDDEVRELLRETVNFDKCPWAPETLLETIKVRYGGYYFFGAGNSADPNATVANAALCLSFISELIANSYENLPPLSTVSSNDSDYDKLAGYLNLINEEDRSSIVSAILNDSLIPFRYQGAVRFSAAHDRLDKNEGLSFLFHWGFFTLASNAEAQEMGYDNLEFDYLKVPNEYARQLFSKYNFEKENVL